MRGIIDIVSRPNNYHLEESLNSNTFDKNFKKNVLPTEHSINKDILDEKIPCEFNVLYRKDCDLRIILL